MNLQINGILYIPTNVYLTKFGYMDPAVTNPQSGALISGDNVRKSIMEFQAFAGLNQTGDLDKLTLEMMNMPRCGVKDKVGFGADARKKRYALQGSRWRVKELTYRITKYPKGLHKNDVDREIEAAFKVWADVTDLSFSTVNSGKVHIEIRFEKGEHGDGDPFDGPGGTLAHAYFPIYGGDAHFDDTEAWTINNIRGTNLFQVAAHEFGHSLGLSHSDVQSALMAPFYRGYEPNFIIDNDDIQGIQALYGQKPARPTPATQRPETGGGPRGGGASGGSLCRDASIDAIVTMSDKETYVFKGTEYWKLTDDGVAQGYPKSISADWQGLPSNLDAAFTWTNGKTYFFKGGEYWRYTDLVRDTGYPKSIEKGFAGIPNNIDAAFVWSGNGKIYFFKGTHYWRFDPTQRPPVKESYPKDISNWEGLPNNLDDALQYSNGYTYFFKDGEYWRFNDRAFRTDTASPEFPRPAGYWWFGCPASGSQVAGDSVNTRGGASPSGGGDGQDDTFDAAGSNDGFDPNNNYVKPRVSESLSSGKINSSSRAFTSPITLVIALFTTLLLKM
ncbi:matrix metalloproteinase-14 isoform X2 [Procambarus clarkii]|uniref:matrix metalloproteinase-14 isoform X2 n=1 Tax=Procambarus clarkii TaxID=6728 RepID=UPI001E675A8B|nr:matrix metalloproteinase-2-like isoform X2 [Procambarus clarkii]